MSGCGLEKDGRTSTCAACGRGRPRGAASVSRRRGPRPRRRAPPPVIRACARRRSASGRARGRRGSCLSRDPGFLASRRRRGAARSRCLLALPLSTGATRRGRALNVLLGGGCSHRALLAGRAVWAASAGRSLTMRLALQSRPGDSKRARPDESPNAQDRPPPSSSTATTNGTARDHANALAEERRREVHNCIPTPSEPDERALSNGSGDNGSTGGTPTPAPSPRPAGGRRKRRPLAATH